MFIITYFGYAAVLVAFEKHLLFNPGIVDKRVLVDLDQVQPSYVLVSSQADEHLGNAKLFAKKKGSIVISNHQALGSLRKERLPSYCTELLEPEKTLDLGKNIQITGYKLSRGGFLTPENTAFHIRSDQGSVIHLGYAKEIGSLTGTKPDLLIIPIAGKNKGTFNSKDAVKATLAINPRVVFPIIGTDEQTNSFLAFLKEEQSSISPLLLSAGETFTLV
jgi:L-ascorbate metabolism protein UlaG (beta-lactamase superfamily)